MTDGYPPRWDDLRKVIYRRDNYRCQNCRAKGGPYGDTILHAHHIVPKNRGGLNAKSNLITICEDCHRFHHGNRIRSICDASSWREEKDIFQRDGYECQNCGEKGHTKGENFVMMSGDELEIHYVVPLDKGGNRKDSNTITLCHSCHQLAHT